MSELRVYWPEDCHPQGVSSSVIAGALRPSAAGKAVIHQGRKLSGPHLTVLERAKLLRDNGRCRVCGHCVTLPLVGEDAELNRSGRPIPGTGTLLGFHCCGCGVEWSV